MTEFVNMSTCNYPFCYKVLSYSLNTVYYRYLVDEDKELTDAWFEKAKTYLLDYSSDVVKVVFQTSESLEEELDSSVGTVLPLFSVSYVILLNFAVFSTLMLDWVNMTL